MVPLKNARWERFAVAVSQGKSHSLAARLAGYSRRSASSFGAQLATKPAIVGRIREIQAEASAPIVLDQSSLDQFKARANAELYSTVPVLDENGAALGLYTPLSPALLATSDKFRI
jgi:hypothetical protein